MIEINSILEMKKHIGALKAVIFDLDDTLYGEKEYLRSGYREVGRLFPEIPDAEDKLWRLFEAGKPAVDEFLKQEGIYSEETKKKCLITYRYHKPNIHLYSGVWEMLMELRGKGYRLGIITDGRPEGQRAKIGALHLLDLFDHIIITDELGGVEYRKPNQTAFQKMKDHFGIEFAEMCYVGDNIKKDFVAPEALGMVSIWFRNEDGLYFKER